MVTLWTLPIEDLEMRYSKDWLNWFHAECKNYNIDVRDINGQAMESNVRTGDVFDDCATNYWKLTQMAELCRLMKNGEIKDDDVIFDFDLWHSGLEAFGYIKYASKRNTRLYGIWHAGTYDKTDFTHRYGMEVFGKGLETAWSNLTEKAFVGSTYHQKMLAETRGIKTIVTGLPLNRESIINTVFPTWSGKKPYVVWTSRLSPEKQPEMFYKIKAILEKDGIDCYSTHFMKLSKKAYYQFLAGASVVLSTATHENFGIGVVEGMTLGCTPVVPDGLSYTDYVPKRWRYNSVDECLDLIRKAIKEPEDCSKYVQKYNYSISNMLREMGFV